MRRREESRPTRGPARSAAVALSCCLALAGVAARAGGQPPAAPATGGDGELTASRVVERYLAARGGAERWAKLRSLTLRGTYAAFSQRSPFTLLRQRGDLYRLDFTLLGGPAVRARDTGGPWWRHPLIQPEAGRLDEGPYVDLLERESRFGLLLLDHREKGVEVELLGPGEVEGQPTVDLRVTLPGGAEETWHLDAGTYLEVAVDSRVPDYTQSAEPMDQRAFFADFREVEGLVIPFQVDWEFGARLEAMTVEEVEVNPELDPGRFSPPPASPG